MGFMNWLLKGAGFETEEVYDDSAEKTRLREQKEKEKQEKKKYKAEQRALKVQKKAEKASKRYSYENNIPPQPVNNNPEPPVSNSPSYTDNPDQYNMSFDSPFSGFSSSSQNVGGFGSKNVEVSIPRKYNDVGSIIKYLKEGEAVVLNLKALSDSDSQRLLDCAYGAVYALNGNLRRLDKNIFFITPEGYNIKNSLQEESRDIGGVNHN